MVRAVPGQTYPGVECRNCKTLFAILGLRAEEDDDDSIEPFDPSDFSEILATCPKCGYDDRYQQTEIRTLLAHRKQ